MTCEEMIYSNDYLDFMVNYLIREKGGAELLRESCVSTITDRLSILHRLKGPDYLTNLGETPYSFIPKLYGLMDSTNMDEVGVTTVQSKNGLGLSGKNVLIGIIDTGIDYTNALFYKEINGEKISRIAAIWDQSIRRLEKSENDAGINEGLRGDMEGGVPVFGTVYEKEQINRALNAQEPDTIVPSRDEDGHGTFLAGIAAGNIDVENDFTGAAPESEIAVVKLKEAKPYLREYFGVEDGVLAYQETDIIYAVQYLLNLAQKIGMPISILIGVGSSNGGHYGVTFLEQYLETKLGNIGIMASVPAGNEGNERLHFRGQLEPEEEYQQVELNVAEGQKSIVLEFWGKRPTTFGIGLVSPQGDRIERIPPRFGQEEEFLLPIAGSSVYVAYQFVEVYSGDELIFVRINRPTPGIWRFFVHADEGRRREYDIWLPLRQFQKADTYFLRPEPENTVINPGNANLPMTLSAYNHLNGSVYANAGRGYNSLNQVVPDLAAPGVNVTGPGLRNNYITKTGTSVAAAHSAGMMALFLQWNAENPEVGYFYAGQIQSLFLKNAVGIPEMVYPNRIVGYGYMNVENVFNDFRVVGR